MPSRVAKTYLVASAPPGGSFDATKPVLPANTSRIALLVQNTGATPGLLHFGGPTQGQGNDIAFTAGQILRWDQSDTVPMDGLWVSSAAAITWCIVETIPGAPS